MAQAQHPVRGRAIRELPVAERPRERLAMRGAGGLTSAELIGLLWGSGSRGRSAVDIATDALAGYDGLTGLARATELELAAIAGVGPAKAAQLVAAFELGRRLLADWPSGRWTVRSPRDVADRLILQMGRLEREELRVVVLDSKNHVLRVATVYQGNVSSSLVRVGELFRDAVRLNAASLILVHNHPSGDPTPSPDDLHLTAEALAAGRLLDIDLLDHLVIGHDAYVSLRDRGVAFERPARATAVLRSSSPGSGHRFGRTTAGTAVTDGPAVETVDLAKQYGRVRALDGLTMTVERGEVFGLLGPNGAGKTTVVKLLLGLARASGGGGRVLGAPLGDRPTRRRIGYLPELFRYQPWMRAREVLALHCDLARLPRADWPAAVDAALDLVGLADRAEDIVGTFSKGMQQRLGLGVALLGAPDLVILDEPTSALDPVGRNDVRAIIRDARERGTTVFLNSHLLTEVERVCDRVAIVDHGRVVEEGRLDDVLGDPGVRVQATGLDEAALAALEQQFGPLRRDGDWLAIQPFDPARVPDLVAAIVAAGGRVHEVDAGRRSLEERFLALLARSGDRTEPTP